MGDRDSFETAKNEFRLDHNVTRSWHGWHRHVTLSMLAFAMMVATRHEVNKDAHPKKAAEDEQTMASLIRWSTQEIRRVATRPALNRIEPARIITWSCWRRAHQAEARRAHLLKNRQL